MTFAPPRNQPIGKIADVLAQNIVQAADLRNDGDHKYLVTEVPVSDPPLPTSSASQYIYVPLTTSQVDVVEFQKSFFKIELKLEITTEGFEANDLNNDTAIDYMYYFIGLKHSTDLIGDYQIRYKGKPIAIQPNATTESFLYQSLRDNSEIIYRPGNHTTSQSAGRIFGFGDGVCGSHINLVNLQDTVNNRSTEVTMGIVIPFTDIQMFQQFDDYPNSIFGDLEIGFKVNTGAFVSMVNDPVDNYECYRVGNPNLYNIAQITSPYSKGDLDFSREFVQIGDTFKGITHTKIDNGAIKLTTSDVSLHVKSFTVSSCSSFISGYNIESSALDRIRKTYTDKPWVVFTQNVDVRSFNHSPTKSGIDTTQQVRFNNTSDIILLFPTTPNEVHGTVFKNPMLTSLNLYTMGNSYPQTPINTRSVETAQLMINSCLNKNATPQRDFAQSLLQRRWDPDDDFEHTISDTTTFILDLKVERNSALGLMNDGLDSDGKNENVRLHAKPEFPDNIDKYCYGENIPPPIIVTVGDAYWAFNSRNGGNCMISSQPFEKQIPVFMSA